MALLKITADGVQYEIEPTKLTNQDVREIERFAGMTFSEFEASRLEGDNVTIWVWLGRRAARNEKGDLLEPGLRLSDVVFDWASVDYDLIVDPTDDPITPAPEGAPADPTPQPEEPAPLPG